MGVFLGIDVGTGSTKALLVDERGQVLAVATSEYPLLTPQPMWTEQRPEDWWSATCASIGSVLEQSGIAPTAVTAVGLTGQMHGLVLLDGHGQVVRPAILWNDQRTAQQCDQIEQRLGRDMLIERTGKPVLTGFTAPKILWVRQHEPDLFGAARHLLLPKDYIRYRLTGALCSDVADASGTSLFDVTRRCWSQEIIDALDIPASWLPQVTESPVISAKVNSDGASATGLPEGLPVVAGAGDQAAEAVGCGLVDDGSVSVTIGTSGVVFAATEQFRLDPGGRLHAYCHAVPKMWHVMGVMLSGGGSLRWYQDTLGREDYDVLLGEIEAEDVPPGCEGLVFLPYLTGERAPHADPNARGAFVGLTLRHTRAHLTRAVMEGVTFGLMDCLELTRDLGIHVDRVRLSGGGARSGLWRQMMADVFGAEVATVNVTQGAAYGAAVLAAVGAELFPDVPTAAHAFVVETGCTAPASDASGYRDAYACYRDLYPTLKDTFVALGAASS
jgi:xylulokinase